MITNGLKLVKNHGESLSLSQRKWLNIFIILSWKGGEVEVGTPPSQMCRNWQNWPETFHCASRGFNHAPKRDKRRDDARMAPARNLKTTNHQDDARMMRTKKNEVFTTAMNPLSIG